MARRGAEGLGGAVVALAAATGLAVGMRSVMALEWPGTRALLALPRIPTERLGVAWSPLARWPAELQAAAVDRMVGVVASLFLAALSVALLNALVLFVEAGAARWREVAVRAALGATPQSLLAHLVSDVRRLVGVGLGLGLPLGLATGGALRAAWPGVLLELAPAEAAGSLLPVLGTLAAASALAYAAVGLRTARRGALAPTLAQGERTTSGRAAVLGRRLLAAGQGGAAGAVILGALALILSLDDGRAVAQGDGEIRVVSVTAPEGAEVGHWSALLDRLGRAVGADREALATPGALLGLGIRDHAMAQCGNCSRGGLPLPFWGAVADHHAVTPGFVDSVGWRIVAGRDLLAADGAGAEPVALVNEAFAARAFEKGDPLGRKIRVGTALDRWYTVVGVVAHASNPVPGGADQRRAAVYLSALQAPPVHGRLVYRGDARTDRAVAGLLSAEGYAPGEPASLAEYRRRAAAPLAWTRWVALLLGTATLLLALHGAHLTAIQVTRRHARPLAVRRVLGASDLRVLAHVLQGAAAVGVGSAILAILLGSLFVALLRQSAAGVPPLGVGPYLLVAAVLVAVSTSAAAQAAREALAVGPGRALAGHRPGRAELPGARSGS